MKIISQKWVDKVIIGIQALLVVLYVCYTFRHDVKEKQNAARRVSQQQEKERLRYTKAKYKQMRKSLKINHIKK